MIIRLHRQLLAKGLPVLTQAAVCVLPERHYSDITTTTLLTAGAARVFTVHTVGTAVLGQY
jgi:hypothetical protein